MVDRENAESAEGKFKEETFNIQHSTLNSQREKPKAGPGT
jgi:hypothetical protein